MKILLLLTLATTSTIVLMAKASPVNTMLVQSDSSNTSTLGTTTAPNHVHFSLNRYTAMVDQLVGAMQTIHILLKEHVRIML